MRCNAKRLMNRSDEEAINVTQEEIIKGLAEIQQRAKSNTHRIDVLEEAQANLNKLVTSVAVIAEKQTQMETGIDEIKSDVKKLTDKPGNRWESVVTVGLTAIVSGLIAYIFFRLGLR